MTRILILSKNQLAEQNLQCSLQRMNEDVYCSSSLLPLEESCLEMLGHFRVVILSDTITTRELEDYLPILLKTNAKILRKGDKEFIKNSNYAWMLDEIDGWFEEDAPIAEIIEIIAKVNRLDNEKSAKIVKQNYPNIPNLDFIQFISCLSKNERKVLLHLYHGKGGIVSREELCQAVWESPSTNSNLSQLSTITCNIKSKMVEMGFAEDQLQTVWGQGYRLGNTMQCYLSQNNFLVNG